MLNPISKRALREKLGLESDADLARFYGISSAAVAQWKEDEPVPELRYLQAVAKQPQAFEATPDEMARAG